MIKKFLLASASIASVIGVTAPAVAQDEEEEERDVVIVRGIRQSLGEALEVKRNSIQNVESIVAEDIGKFPDNNVIEALQRVTGVQVTDRGGGEASALFIRGLPDVTTTWNGRFVFTGSGRQLALQDIPANLVKQVDVYKSRAAEQIENGIAGQINVMTRRPFDFDGLAFSAVARGIYQEERETFDPNVSALLSNRWQTEWGEFGALVNFSYAQTRYRDQSITAGAAVPFATADNPPMGIGAGNVCDPPNPGNWVPLERIFPTDCRAPIVPGDPSGGLQQLWSPGLDRGLPTEPGSTLAINGVDYPYLLARDALFASDFRGDRKRPAANVAFQWSPNESSVYTAEFFWQGYREELFNNLHFTFADWWGALGPDPASTISLYPDTNIIKTRTVGFPFGFNSGDYTEQNTDTFVYALNGDWRFGDRLHVAADLSYQESDFESDFTAVRTTRVPETLILDFNAGNGLPAWEFNNPDELTDPAAWTVAELFVNTGSNGGHATTFSADADYDLDPSGDGIFKEIRFGFRWDKRAASERQAAPTPAAAPLGQPLSNFPELQWVNKGFFNGRADVPSSWVVANGYYIGDNRDEVLGLYGAQFPERFRTFKVEETNTAGYVQIDLEPVIFGRPAFIQAGVRYVNVSTDMEFVDLNDPALTTTTANQDVDDWLPSATLKYELTDNLLLRFNYGETLRRPNFVDLNPNFDLTDDLTMIGFGSGSGGNPDLVATTATNMDLALEWYFAPQSALYATVFRRKIEGLVVPLRRPITLDTPLMADLFVVNQPVNASDGTLKGVEVGAVYFPDFLPGVLDGLGFIGSLTVLDSEQNIPQADDAGNIIGQETSDFFGVSDFSYNTTLAYDKNRLGMRLSWVWRDDFLNNNEARLFANPIGVWRRPEKSLDLQLSYDIFDNATVTLDATNLTNEIQQSYYQFADAGGPELFNFGNTIYSRTFAIGLRFSF